MFLEPLSKIIGSCEKNWRVRFWFHVISWTACSKGTNSSPVPTCGNWAFRPLKYASQVRNCMILAIFSKKKGQACWTERNMIGGECLSCVHISQYPYDCGATSMGSASIEDKEIR